jgi:hypothetical protein
MLKTALLTLGFCVVGTGAFAIETPKYDRKIERAAMEQVARKMGDLRETLVVEARIAEPVMALNTDLDIKLDLGQTAGIAAKPKKPHLSAPKKPKNFRIIAGEYNR